MLRFSLPLLALFAAPLNAASDSGRWFSDRGDGTYRNPVLVGDWSDPDVVRVGEDYYLTASSFTEAPGLPILHSRDLVNWTLIGHALPRIPPDAHYATPRPGAGVWAPTIRHRDGRFMIYYPDPDRGIFLVTAPSPSGPWSAPVLVDGTPGAIDPAPFWDDDGKVWLVHGFARSRAGVANRIMLKPLSKDGAHVTGPGKVIIDGDQMPPVDTSLGPRPWQTTEGPKLYKRNGWYYVFAPSGGVKGGWQGVFRSRSLSGPWEGRDVMDQGKTATNGPHQGAWVHTQRGEDWFLHFQDRDSYGRMVHLEPMRWVDDWPVIGMTVGQSGRGEPVATYRKPDLPQQSVDAPAADDEFATTLSPSWSFLSNPLANWARIDQGMLRLEAVPGSPDLFENGAVLAQRLPGLDFTVTTKMTFSPLRPGERAGLAISGQTFAWIGLERGQHDTRIVSYAKSAIGTDAPITRYAGPDLPGGPIWLRLTVSPVSISVGPPDWSPYWPSVLREEHARVSLSFSTNGIDYTALGPDFVSRPGRWVGARLALFASAAYGTPAATATTNGYASFDWWRITERKDATLGASPVTPTKGEAAP